MEIPNGTYVKVIVALAATALCVACADKPITQPTVATQVAMPVEQPVAPIAQNAIAVEAMQSTLKALSFEKQTDGWYLTMPVPLIFEFNGIALSSGAVESLQKIAKELLASGIDQLRIAGHTDNIGTKEYNQSLSKRCAEAVAKVVIEAGFPAKKVQTIGFGASTPAASNATAEGRSANRRVVIIVDLL